MIQGHLQDGGEEHGSYRNLCAVLASWMMGEVESLIRSVGNSKFMCFM